MNTDGRRYERQDWVSRPSTMHPELALNPCYPCNQWSDVAVVLFCETNPPSSRPSGGTTEGRPPTAAIGCRLSAVSYGNRAFVLCVPARGGQTLCSRQRRVNSVASWAVVPYCETNSRRQG